MDIKETFKSINESVKAEFPKTLSVSKCIDYVKKPFDQDAVAQRCFEKGYDNPDDKYYHMTKEDILKAWADKAALACHYGSLLDSYIGMVLNHEDDKLEEWKLDNSYEYDMRLHNLCDGFDQFYKLISNCEFKYEYVTREEKMYIKSKESGNTINGRFDCLFYSPVADRYLLIDWKSSEKIETENKWEKLLGPLFDKEGCNGNTYSTQVLLYKKALCETYSITTPDKVDVRICHMHEPDDNKLNFTLYSNLYEYDSHLLDQVIDFAYKKEELKNKQLNS